MTTIYISGKITGVNHYQKKFAAAEMLLKHDHPHAEIINPALNDIGSTDGMSDEEIWQAYMAIAREQVKRSDIVALLPCWKQSRGAMEEVALAKENGILTCALEALLK